MYYNIIKIRKDESPSGNAVTSCQTHRKRGYMLSKHLFKTIWAYRYLPVNHDDTKDFWYLVDISGQFDFELRFKTLKEAEEYFRKVFIQYGG